MKNCIVSILPDGTVVGLFHHNTPPPVADKLKVNRISEVCWDEDNQKWYVEWKAGMLKGTRLLHPDGTLRLFADYATAVAAEIQEVENIQKAGQASTLL